MVVMSGSAPIIPYMGILAILFITIRLGPVDARIGYDCSTELQNTATIPMEMISGCDKEDANLKISYQDIALLQLNEFNNTIVLQCKIEIQRSINKCGSQSFNSSLNFGYNEYVHPISRKNCEIAHDHGTMKIRDMVIDGLRLNAITTRNITLAGRVNSTGACTGGNYSDPYGTWDNVVVTGKVKITLKRRLIKVKLDSDIIELPSGHKCKFTDGECVDSEGGHTFWDTLPQRSCSEKTYSVLYNGTALKLQSEDERVYSVMVNKTRFSFTTIGNETSCGVTLFKTESPKLFIAESEDLKHLEELKIIGNHTNNSDIFQYENDETIYAEKFIRYPIQYLYKNVMEHQCRREQAILEFAVRTAFPHLDEFAFQFMGGLGYTAIMEEDKFHIVQCVPVEVKLQQQDKCYNQLPILRGNQSMFLTPWTHIITNNATELPCTSSLLQDHELESTRYKVLAKPAGLLEPKRLKLSTKLT